MTESHPTTEPQPRRSFLKLAIHSMGALFAAILGIPAALYLVDARNRPVREKGFRAVDGLKLTDLQVGQPLQGTIRDVRQDAWTLHPNDVVGRVWVIKTREFTGKPTKQDLTVFTTICPHLGCSINCNADVATGFTCPCHNAQFKQDGAVVTKPDYSNPAPRGMDTLEWTVNDEQPDILRVEYVNFRQGEHSKIPKA
jgi:quinol---cytochrome c reductase iron-sulfur subunit, bacillus type